MTDTIVYLRLDCSCCSQSGNLKMLFCNIFLVNFLKLDSNDSLKASDRLTLHFVHSHLFIAWYYLPIRLKDWWLEQ